MAENASKICFAKKTAIHPIPRYNPKENLGYLPKKKILYITPNKTKLQRIKKKTFPVVPPITQSKIGV